MTQKLAPRVSCHGYQIHQGLFDFIDGQVLSGTGLDKGKFWQGFAKLLTELTPQNQYLLAEREVLQRQINAYHLNPQNQPFDAEHYQNFLTDIGYITPEPDNFTINPTNVDDEVAIIAGPQLVVPVMNARYALNAANARWGSLYDALYGTDVIGDEDDCFAGSSYNPKRGAKVIAYGREFLDLAVPLSGVKHADVDCYQIIDGKLTAKVNGANYLLEDESQLQGLRGDSQKPEAIILKNNNLHIEILFDNKDVIGKSDKAGVKDIMLESAISTIMDCEDSIAAVDGDDKTQVYKNWFGLMTGDLTETITKNGKQIERRLADNRQYTDLNGKTATLSGRSLLFVRNVGHLMTNDAVLTANGKEVPEGLLDGVFTSLISLYDLQRKGKFVNSQKGSIYIVKPKMHGPKEVAFSCELFSKVEQLLDLEANTIKMGIMDEERRTSVNLKACIYEAKERVVFINTGFLDRTGDDIHTSMYAGIMVRKDAMKDQAWIQAYESRNVAIGLQAGLKGKAQIGKGMWAMPDFMAQMMRDKIGHPQSGANCAWVPSPTAATLHAMHYHQENVTDIQQKQLANLQVIEVKQLITLPLLVDVSQLSLEQIEQELDNNVQGLLGYVVRWVDQGIGCSKVPDIHDIGRMEDRATLRISSQHICNWWHHGVISTEQVVNSLKKMAKVVDNQNVIDDLYTPMSADFEQSLAFTAAMDLIFKGKEQPSGYTEPLLHQSRIAVKKQAVK